MKNCLVLIDVQNGFITKETEYILTPVNNLIESKKFDFIIITRRKTPSFNYGDIRRERRLSGKDF